MPTGTDTFLAELDLEPADQAVRKRGNDPGSEILRGGLTAESTGGDGRE
jgi:hypothetical protein